MFPTLKLPASLTVDFQPYGQFTITNLEQVNHPANPRIGGSHDTYIVQGYVVQGVERSRLLQFTSDRDISGERRGVYGLTQEEIDNHVRTGHPVVRVAM